MKVVIIGGGAAGASCAARLRRLDETAEIIILEKTNEISIANCGLPYYISNIINKREKMFVSSPEKFKNWFNVDIRLNSEVVNINRQQKYVQISNGDKVNYDKLVITTGAKPFIPDFEGIDHSKIYTIRTLYDADRIKNDIKNKNIKNAVIIGGGFIGVEAAENLVKCGIKTTLIEKQKQILPSLDYEIAAFAQNEIRKNTINLILSDGIKCFKNNKIILDSGKEIEFDIIIIAIGVKPEIKIASDAGIQTNRGIIVNEYMQTSDSDIFAAGDNTEIKDFVSGQNTLVPLAGPANRQGRIIADNLAGLKSKYNKTQAASIIKIFNLTAACVGNNENRLKEKNIDYKKALIFGRSHAGYYPGSSLFVFKILFNSEGEILGSQAIGIDGVDKRIDIISSIMRNNGTIQDLTDSELCYAPPFSSAKDPVNILGMTAENIMNGLFKPAFIEDIEGSYLIDVRDKAAYLAKTIENSVNIPISEIRFRLNEIPKNKKIILFCNTGHTSYVASRILIQHGFDNVYSLMGGIELFKELTKNQKILEPEPVT